MDYCQTHNIQHIKNAVRTPRANGQVERANRTILSFLRTVVEVDEDWDLEVEDLQWTVNTQINSTTGFTPNQLLFDFELRDPQLNIIIDAISDDCPASEEIPIQIKRQQAMENIKRSKDAWKKRFDSKHSKPQKFKKDDIILIENEPRSTGESRKLEPKYKGPYIVAEVLDHDRYVIKDIPGMQRTSKPLNTVFTAEKMRPFCLAAPNLDGIDVGDSDGGDDTEDGEESGEAEL